MKNTILNKILYAIHITFFSSILCFGMTFLSCGLLMIPAFAAAFMLGKSIIYKEFDITDSVIKTYLIYFKEAFGLMKYVGINILMLLNGVGMLMAGRFQMELYAIICLCIIAILLMMVIYLVSYYVFCDKKFTLAEVAICMIYKPLYTIAIFMIMVLFTFFLNLRVIEVFMFAGTAILFIVELITFLHFLHVKKLCGKLDGEKYASLVLSKKELEEKALNDKLGKSKVVSHKA